MDPPAAALPTPAEWRALYKLLTLVPWSAVSPGLRNEVERLGGCAPLDPVLRDTRARADALVTCAPGVRRPSQRHPPARGLPQRHLPARGRAWRGAGEQSDAVVRRTHTAALASTRPSAARLHLPARAPSADGGVASVRRTPAWLLRSGDVCWQENRGTSVVDFLWRAFCPRFAGTPLHRRAPLRCAVARRAATRRACRGCADGRRAHTAASCLAAKAPRQRTARRTRRAPSAPAPRRACRPRGCRPPSAHTWCGREKSSPSTAWRWRRMRCAPGRPHVLWVYPCACHTTPHHTTPHPQCAAAALTRCRADARRLRSLGRMILGWQRWRARRRPTCARAHLGTSLPRGSATCFSRRMMTTAATAVTFLISCDEGCTSCDACTNAAAVRGRTAVRVLLI